MQDGDLVVAMRPRTARSARYDRAILDAAVTLADLEGWPSVTFSRVAAQAGLSRTAVLSRHPDRAALAAAAWRQRLAGPFADALAAVIDAGPAVNRPVDVENLTQALSAFGYPNEGMRATAELLLVSRYELALQESVDATAGAKLGEWLTPRRGRLSRAQAAQRGFLVALAIGLLLEARRQPAARIDLDGALVRVSYALSNPAPASWLPTTAAAYMDAPVAFDTDDPAWDAVLQATLDEVGTHGYDAATVDAIARASGYTQGVIFNRYATKLEMFLDATDRMLSSTGRQAAQFQAGLAAAHGDGIADAVMIRELMAPHRKAIRTITFEQLRLAWHQPDMLTAFRTALADPTVTIVAERPELTEDQARSLIHIEFARGLGSGLLADLHPDASKLPYDVVLVPFIESP